MRKYDTRLTLPEGRERGTLEGVIGSAVKPNKGGTKSLTRSKVVLIPAPMELSETLPPGRAPLRRIPDPGGLLREIARETGCDDWQITGKPLLRRNCGIFFLRSERFRLPEMALKIYQPGAVKPNLARDMHAKSVACHTAATFRYTVPEPIACFPERNALVMERVLVPTAGSLLRNGFHTRATRDRINRQAALWLKWFHACSPIVQAPFESRYFLKKLMTLQGRIARKNPAVPAGDPFLLRCIEVVQRVSADLDGHIVPHASAHGDFTPFNLFARGETMVGFDYLANRRLPVTYDICRFLLYLDIYRLLPAGASELRQYGCRQADFEIFMGAYGGDQAWTENGRWLQFQFLEVVRRLTSLALRRAEGRKLPFGVIETASMRRTAKLLMEVLR
jgi:hypothetical protein